MTTADSIGPNEFKSLFSEEEQESFLPNKLTDYFPALIYVYDADKKRLRYLNKKVTDFLGYNFDDITAWDEDIMNMVFKDDVDFVKTELEKFHDLKDNETYSFNARLNHKLEQFRYFKTHGTILRRNKEGKPASLLFIAQDITHEIKSDTVLNAARELAHETEALLQFGTWQINGEKNTMEWSDGMYSLLGYDKNEVAQPVTIDFYFKHVHPTDVDALKLAFTKAAEEKKVFEYSYNLVTRDKTIKKVSFKAKFVYDERGALKTTLGTTCDITEQYNLYNDLVVYKEMVLEKQKFLGYGSWDYNLKTDVFTWSDGMYNLFGYNYEKDKDQLKIDQEFFSRHIASEEIDRIKKSRLDILTGDKLSYIWQFEISGADGTKKIIETYGKVVTNEEGHPFKIIGTSRDVTRLHQYEIELERKIKELDKSNKELEEFAYAASHDLQEPLRKIATFSERLQEKFSSDIPGDAKNYLDRITTSTNNMRLLIDNLLEFSRVSRENTAFEKKDMNEVLGKCIAEIELKIEETNTVIKMEGKLPVLEIIPSQIQQLFNNLLLNAIKFRKKNVDPLITISSQKIPNKENKIYGLPADKSYYKICIADNGIGFEPQYAERIFEMFQRLHGKTEYPGSGVGLAICKKIAENHNGRLLADSLTGKGSDFTLILPEKQSYL